MRSMVLGMAAILAAILAVAPSAVAASRTPPASSVLVPEASEALRHRLEDQAPHVKAVLVWRDDCPTFTYYKAGVDADTRLPLHSMTKSVVSALVGIVQQRGLLGFDRTLGQLLPESLEAGIDPRVRAITIRQMLTMTAGLDAEAKPPQGLAPRDLWRWSLARSVLSPPGRDFRYDNYGANLLSVLLTRETGQTAEAIARDTLFGPLGIRNVTWTDDGDGHSLGAYGLWMTAPDMAKIGLLSLHGGRWAGRPIVPEPYARASTRRQNAGGTPFRGAYGYLWWTKPTRAGYPAFFAAGSDGQAIYVVPRLNLVIVLASDAVPPGGSVAFVTDVLLPAASTLRRCVDAKPRP